MEGRTKMDENVAKFSEKMKELLALAKKKKNVLEYQEISDFFSDMELDAEQFDKILEFLEHTSYDESHHFYRSCTYSTSGNFTAKNYKLSSQDSFLLVFENIYDQDHQLLMTNKHYIPCDLFKIDLYI